MTKFSDETAVQNFQEYIRIKTVQPNPDYASCVSWLQRQATEINAEFQVFECVPGKPIVLMSVLGLDPTLPSILLNSHTDVVPVYPDCWKHEPFSAYKEDNGNIYGRGTQDMKSVGVQYLEAMKRLTTHGKKLLRTVHLSFVPDEEIGGFTGMAKFVETEIFRKLNIGFALDEGYANASEKMTVFYGERIPWWIFVICEGRPGHGSQFLKDTAGEKLKKIIDKFLAFRDSEEKKLNDNSSLKLGDVVTTNLTTLEGGVQPNVVPANLTVGFDMRIPPTTDLVELEKKIAGWCQEAGDKVSYHFKQKSMIQKTTCVENGKSVWWDAFSSACQEEHVMLETAIFPAATDACFLRNLDIPALGFSPMNHTPILLHDHNEFLNEKIFLRGIEIYCTILTKIANISR